jgi:three-Cys-motif partner protein
MGGVGPNTRRFVGDVAAAVSDDADDSPEAEELDNVGPWSIRKNDILEYYTTVYAEITGYSAAKFKRTYIDGFANRGRSRLKGTNDIVAGSAIRALNIPHPFDRYVFVEQDHDRMVALRKNVGERENVEFVEGDANNVLPATVFPTIRYDNFERALCFLDPYNMSGLRWATVAAAGANQAIESIIHFPTMDAHRTVLMADQGKIRPTMREKMNAYWGDESWLVDAYTDDGMLPLPDLRPRKREPRAIIDAFRSRLRYVAGFPIVSEAFPMRNVEGSPIYHLVFASHNKVARKVMSALEKRFI